VVRRRRVIDPDQKNLWRVAGTTSALGFEIALCLLLGVGGGLWLDRHFRLSPWFTLLGAFAGIGAAIKALIRVSREYKKLAASENEPPSPPAEK
jgi:F0F1-type ATP synthase assembly protein I